MTIEARLPDGTVLRFPDGTADDVIDRTVQQQVSQGQRMERARQANSGVTGYVDSLGRQFAQGATFGLMDEGAAALNTGAGMWGNYGEALANERARDEAFRRDNPVMSTVANVAGGIAAPAVGVMRGAAHGADWMMRLGRSALGRGAVAGAVGGGLTGFGEGEGGFGQRVENATTGASLGAAGGAALGVGLNLAGRVGGRAMNVAGLRNPETQAERQTLRALERGGVTVEDLSQRLAGAPDHTILPDVGGRNTVNLAALAANVPGRSMQMADDVVNARRAGSPDRIAAASDAAFGGGSGDDLRAATQALRTQRSAAAAPLYERAFRIQMTPDEYARVANFVEDRTGQEAFRRGIRIAEIEALQPGGSRFDPAAYGVQRGEGGQWVPIPGQAPNMRLMDAIKRGFDEIVEGYRDPQTGRLNLDEYGRAVNDARIRYRDELASMYHPYRRALQAWAGPSASLDATTRGQQAFRVNRDTTQAAAERIGGGDQEFFRLGAGRAVTDMTSDPRTAPGNARRLLEDRQMQARLGSVLPDETRREVLRRVLQNEVDVAAVNNAVSPRAGSQTGRLTAAGEDAAIDPPGGVMLGLLDAAQGGGATAAAARGVTNLYRRGQGINSETADALARLLFNTDQRANAQTVARLGARQEEDVAAAAARQAMMGRLLRGLGVGMAPDQGF